MENNLNGAKPTLVLVDEVSVANPTEQPAAVEPFFFSLTADENGVTELKFRKEASKLFGTLLFTLDYINQSFEQPFPTVGDFLRHLGDIADKVEAKVKEDAANADSQPATTLAS